MWWSGEVRSNRFADHTSLYVRCPRGFLRFASRLDEDSTSRFCFSMAGEKDRSCRPIGNLPSARSFRHRSWQMASSISAARMVFSTRWSEEVRAGRALLGTDAPITSRAFRKQNSRALGKGLIRIVGSLAAGYFAASLFSDGFLELPPPPRTFSSLLGSRSRTNMSNSITRFFFASSLGFVCCAIIAPPARAMMTTASWSVEQKPLLCGSMWRKVRLGEDHRQYARRRRSREKDNRMKSVLARRQSPSSEVRAGLAFARYPDGCFGWQPKVRARHGESSTGRALLKR